MLQTQVINTQTCNLICEEEGFSRRALSGSKDTNRLVGTDGAIGDDAQLKRKMRRIEAKCEVMLITSYFTKHF